MRFVVVGGYALAVHGRPRSTKHVDVFVEPTHESAERLLLALGDFGFGGLGLVAVDFSTPGRIVQLGVAPNRVDLVTANDGVSFAEAWDGPAIGHFGVRPFSYLGRQELLRNKRAAGRPQDLAHIDARQQPWVGLITS